MMVISMADKKRELAILRVWANAKKYAHKWKNKNDDYWCLRLVQEVGELSASLADDHEHTPDYEMTQIAGICINWLAKRDEELDNDRSS
jgi:NTP pyrophosphatase (non-canonical NTP hydrolase)